MPDKFFVSTNILIYAHDRTTGVKHERARRLIEKLWTSGQGVLSTQVLQELCVNLRRKVARALGVDEIRRLVNDYISWEIVVNSAEAVIQAVEWECGIRPPFGTPSFCKRQSSQAPQFSTPRTWQRGRVMARFG